MKFIITLFLSVLVNAVVTAQNVGIGTTAPQASAQLDVSSTTKGMLLPRMTSTQRKDILAPVAGLLVYDTDKNSLFMFDGNAWMALLFDASGYTPPIIRQASDGAANDLLGYAVAMDGDYAAVGAPGDASNTGAVYIFFRVGGIWTEQRKIVASDGVASDGFGRAVTLKAGMLVVGAPNAKNGTASAQGAAYVFNRAGTSWGYQQKLIASNSVAGLKFGTSVALNNNNFLAIGAPGKNYNTATVYMFRWMIFFPNSYWGEQQIITHEGDNTPYNLIESATVETNASGNYMIIGYRDLTYGTEDTRGGAYIYFYNGTAWVQQLRIYGLDNLGESVAIDGDYAFIGASVSPKPGTTTVPIGKVEVRRRVGTSWSVTQTLRPLELVENDAFGSSVSISGGKAIVGAYGNDVGNNSFAGGAYIFTLNGTLWEQERKIFDPAAGFQENLGTSVSISGNNVLAGAPFANSLRGKVIFLNIE